MKFSCLKENLSVGVSSVGHVALRSGGLPILHNIFFSSGDAGLHLSATNLEIGIEHTVRGKLEEAGECLVSAKLLLDLLPLLPEGQLYLENTKNGLVITTNDTTSTLRVTPPTDFPLIPRVENKKGEFSLPQPIIQEVLEKTVLAIGRVEQRPQFGGVYFSFKENLLTAAATDGYRLAEAVVPLSGGSYVGSIIIPGQTIEEVIRLFSTNTDDAAITFVVGDNQVNITVGATALTSRLIEGDFPDYEALFPTETTPLTVSPIALTKAIKATTLFSRSGIADITLNPQTEGKIEIFSESGEIGSHHTSVTSSGEVKNTNPVVLNAKFFMDGLGACGNDATVALHGPERPVLISPVSQGAVRYRYLIMPIRE